MFGKGKWAIWVAAGGGLLAGIGLMLGAEQGDQMTSDQAFCAGACHSMKAHVANKVYYRESLHRSTPTGVVADCGDCHIPNRLIPATSVHIRSGIHDIYATLVYDLDDPQRWEARRPVLTERARQWFRDTDSSTCRHCHEQEAIKPASQAGRTMHEMARKNDMTCIDCHTNLVHPPP